MKKINHGFSLILVVIILAILLIGFSISYLYLRGSTKIISSVSPSPTPEQNEVWKTYSNETDSFSINYPPNWNLYPPTGPGEESTTSLANFDLNNPKDMYSTDYLRINIFGKIPSDSYTWWWLEEANILAEENFTLDGIPGKKYFSGITGGQGGITIVVQKGSNIYQISYYSLTQEEDKESDKGRLINQILSTFRFTD